MAKERLEKHTVLFREGDYEYLQNYCEPRGIRAATVIREKISKLVDTLRAKSTTSIEEIDFDV